MNELLWFVTRASALTSVVLLTFTVVLGALTAGRAAPVAVPAFVRSTLHRTLALLMVCFVAVHVITAVTETYVDICWVATIVPFTSAYDTFWVGLGTFAVDLLVATTITSLLRSRIPARTWRGLHLPTYALWPIALAHGLGTTTTDGTLMIFITIGCAALGGAAVVWRLASTTVDASRRRLATEQSWS